MTSKKYYEKNKERLCEINRLYRKSHREQEKERWKIWLSNPENREKRKKYHREYMRKYIKQHKQKSSLPQRHLWYIAQKRKNQEKTKIMKMEFGGKCQKCGYNKCFAALEFHHMNGEKKYEISRIWHNSLEVIRKELQKCKLLCANCHREEHNKMENMV